MSEQTLYHGTAVRFDAVDLARSRPRRDFGVGFYTTTLYDQACSWARNVHFRYGGDGVFVKHFRFVPGPDLKCKRFDGMTSEWLEFVKANRLGAALHGYDIVEGPVANDNTMRTIFLYVDGTLTAEEALNRLKFFKVNDQISFHTAKAIACLKEIRTEVLDA